MRRCHTPVLLFLVTICSGCAPINPPGAPQGESYPHLFLGNPSNASEDSRQKDNFLMRKKYFALSYNNNRGTPNWVSWRVTKDDLGDAPRKPVFDTDNDLPEGFQRITHKDYNGSGFDRGHMCPHSDRAANQEMSFSTFIMTNIIPQAPKVNQKTWAELEIYLRNQVKHGHAAYIIAGPDGKGGTGKEGFKETIAGGRVVVPAKCWKIAVLAQHDQADDLSKFTARTRVIAVMMPNDESIDTHWAKYRVSVREIEKQTGYTFFDRLPADAAIALKDEVDSVRISHSSHPGGTEE
jgi:endonuclease G